MTKYNITGTQNFYGSKQPFTYYKVPAHKVWKCFEYMCREFNLTVLFVYEAKQHENYVGSYSAKYQNFKDAKGIIHKTYNF